MKKVFLIINALSTILLSSCVQATLMEETEKQETKMVEVDLNLDFSTKEDAWVTSKGLGSRATDKEEVKHIVVKVFDSNDKVVLDTTQVTSKANPNSNFSILKDLRISAGTYTFVAIAYTSASDNLTSATINSPTEVIIPEKNLYETYATVKKSVEIGYDKSNSIELNLKLMVTKLTFKVMDAITPETAYVRATVNTDADEAESLTCDPSTRLFTSDAAFSLRWDIEEQHHDVKGATFNIIAGFTDYPKKANLLLEALDSNENVIYSRTFTSIELNRAKRKTLSTNLYIVDTETIIDLEEWTDEEKEEFIP